MVTPQGHFNSTFKHKNLRRFYTQYISIIDSVSEMVCSTWKVSVIIVRDLSSFDIL